MEPVEARADRGPGPALADRDLDLATAGTTAAQLHKVLAGFRLLMSLIPMVAIAASLLIFHYYPLDGRHLEDVKSKVGAMHAEKAGR